jgi:hypothetical protein
MSVYLASDSFHQEISDCLGRDRSVLQLTIDMTEYMAEIHHAIVQCMVTTLAELKRSNTTVRLLLLDSARSDIWPSWILTI